MIRKAKNKDQIDRILNISKEDREFLTARLMGLIEDIEINNLPDSYYARHLTAIAYNISPNEALHQIDSCHKTATRTRPISPRGKNGANIKTDGNR